jgi:hypothetical protein
MGLTKSTVPLVLLVVLMSVVFWLVVFPPRAPRIFLNHRHAVQNIKNLSSAERDFAAKHPNIGFACNLSDLAEQGLKSPPDARSIDPVLASGTKSWYHFEIQCAQDLGETVARYTITAAPVTPGRTGKFVFCTDQSGEIWHSQSGLISDCLTTRKPVEPDSR